MRDSGKGKDSRRGKAGEKSGGDEEREKEGAEGKGKGRGKETKIP